jgi:hypothetical protein
VLVIVDLSSSKCLFLSWLLLVMPYASWFGVVKL